MFKTIFRFTGCLFAMVCFCSSKSADAQNDAVLQKQIIQKIEENQRLADELDAIDLKAAGIRQELLIEDINTVSNRIENRNVELQTKESELAALKTTIESLKKTSEGNKVMIKKYEIEISKLLKERTSNEMLLVDIEKQLNEKRALYDEILKNNTQSIQLVKKYQDTIFKISKLQPQYSAASLLHEKCTQLMAFLYPDKHQAFMQLLSSPDFDTIKTEQFLLQNKSISKYFEQYIQKISYYKANRYLNFTKSLEVLPSVSMQDFEKAEDLFFEIGIYLSNMSSQQKTTITNARDKIFKIPTK